MNILPVKVYEVGNYCIKFLSNSNVELGGDYNQTQCATSNNVPDINGRYTVNFEVPINTANYTIPKVRVFKDSLLGFSKDFLNVEVLCGTETTTGTTTTIPVTTTTTPITGTISTLLWEPDSVEDDFLKIQATSLNNGTFTLTDIGSNQGLTCYYKINGASNPISAKLLSSYPVPGNTELHILKYGHTSSLLNVNDPNSEIWRAYFDESSSLVVKLASLNINIQYNA